LILLFLTLSTSCIRAETITTESLLNDMTDMKGLSVFPEPAYKTIQFSSYDRTARIPGGPNWFANSDGFGSEPLAGFEEVLRKPHNGKAGKYLICNVEGPGAIVRTWSAGGAMAGKIKMYLDDSNEPIYDGPALEFFRHPYRKFAEKLDIDDSFMDGTFLQRDACYFPVAFAKRCKVLWFGDKKQIHFYHLQIRKYDKNTKVKTFDSNDFRDNLSKIKDTAKILSNPLDNYQYSDSAQKTAITAELNPGQKHKVIEITGQKAVEKLTLKAGAEDITKALRQTIITIAFDGFQKPQIQAPLGDFFGAGPGINPYNSLPFTVEQDGTMTCRFVMPFEKAVAVCLENKGRQKVSVTGEVLLRDYNWSENSMHFTARWRTDRNFTAGGWSDARDMPYLLARGRGLYVGSAIMLLNPSPIPAGGGNWWGEGDEKVFVDDDTFPSIFGTGSEDYYNYSWGSNQLFAYPYCSQPRCDGPAHTGRVVNNRYHILDSLPFKHNISFYMELWHHSITPGFVYSRISYYYARPGTTDDHRPISDTDIQLLEMPRWEPLAEKSAKGSVFFQAENIITQPGKITLQKDNLYAAGELMHWQAAKKKDSIELEFPIRQTGSYTIALVCNYAPGHGSFSVELDNQPLKITGMGAYNNSVNLDRDYGAVSRTVRSSARKLTKGKHRLTIIAAKPADIALDFLWLQKMAE